MHASASSMALYIDVATIDRTTFNVKELNGRVLVTPMKSKHEWGPDELGFRSLVLDAETGRVLSRGFDKFFNYGEDTDADALFDRAIAEGWPIEYTEKRDGSLIIADSVGDVAYFRTRGNFTLGEFQERVDPVLAQHPRIREWLLGRLLTDEYAGLWEFVRRNHSLLFEYTAPENRIVLRYDTPELVMIGAVSKVSGRVASSDLTQLLAKYLEVPHVTAVPVGNVLDIKGWTNKEGVVARVTAPDGRIHLLKLKCSQYVKLHALRFRLYGRKIWKLCYLLGTGPSLPDLERAVKEFGIDHEGWTELRPDVEEYVQVVTQAQRELEQIEAIVRLAGQLGSTRKQQVEIVRANLPHVARHSGLETGWHFPAAMKLLDRNTAQAERLMYAAVLQESAQALASWKVDAEVQTMLSAPVFDDA